MIMSLYDPQQERLRRSLQDFSSDEDFEESNTSDNHVTSMEFTRMDYCTSESESEESDICGNIQKCSSNSYRGIGKTIWRKKPPMKKARVQNESIVLHLPCVKSSANHAKIPSDYFSLFIDDDIISQIALYTNIFIQDNAFKFSRDDCTKLTDESEVKAVIGLLILAGLHRFGHRTLVDLWQRNGLGMDIFWSTMTLKRFRFLLCTLRFDDITTRDRRKKLDRFAPFREFFERFVKNCEKYYSASEYTTIDEQLVQFHGQCSFLQYNPKRAKTGLKIFTLCDAKTKYTIRMEVCVKMQPAGPFKLSNSPFYVVNRLVKSIEGSGRNVTINNQFCNILLAKELLKKKITLIGALKSNNKEISNMLTSVQNRKGVLFGFLKELTVVAQSSGKDKNVILLSSMRTGDTTNFNTGTDKEPEIITIYNMTKDGVDEVDEMCSTYSTCRKTRRWPLALFFRMVDIAGINAQVMYTCDYKNRSLSRKKFLQTIGISLINPTLRKRAESLKLPRPVQETAARLTGVSIKQMRVERPKPVKVKRCVICPRKMDRKGRTLCCKCLRGMCVMHMNYVCCGCMNTDSFVGEIV